MDISINARFKTVSDGNFDYSNIESRYGNNTQYFLKDGKPFTIIAGEIHFSRCPKDRWKSTLLKMRDCGLNEISTYVFWNYHEEEKGVFDFSDNKDIASFLALCKELNMPCILRIGPWCHGEVVYGGFPKRIAHMKGKRTNDPKYLSEVKEYWQGLYKEVKPFLDGETVIGLQLENEYTGKTNHIKALKKIAVDIGFKVPFFTMTAWPSGVPDPCALPLFGGYPDAPWSGKKSALKPNNRFAITNSISEDEIGADLIKNRQSKSDLFNDVPHASCETGPGNQVTQLRRPFISEKDGYGVGFAKFASGINWLGYYMFCGGANPNHRLMQESRKTGYPNNYQIIDYDFQAPLSRYGVCRAHGDLLRLMHLFINEFDPEICVKQTFFPKWKSADPNDTSFLKCSVRANPDKSGYFFSSTHEKSLKYNDFKDVSVQIDFGEDVVELPKINIKADTMFFYPFNLAIGKIHFDYILAQPIVKFKSGDETICYFTLCEGIDPKFSLDGNDGNLIVSREGTLFEADGEKVRIIVLNTAEAKKFHFINGKPYFLDGTVYSDENTIYCEQPIKTDLKNKITLEKAKKVKLPYNHYLYSNGKRSYYKLTLPKNILKDRFDVCLEFDFTGLNLQVFSGNTLINDYFNIDKKFIMNLADYRKYIDENPELIIKTVPKTKYGVSNVYNEIPIPLNSDYLSISEVYEIKLIKEKL